MNERVVSKTYKWLRLYSLIVLLWLPAVHFANHSGIALMVNQKTGEKYCTDMLAHYLGISQGAITDYLGTLCVILAMTLPLIAVGVGLFHLKALRQR